MTAIARVIDTAYAGPFPSGFWKLPANGLRWSENELEQISIRTSRQDARDGGHLYCLDRNWVVRGDVDLALSPPSPYRMSVIAGLYELDIAR
jgi:hypothetical protein